jgi:hypothetical protein
VVSGAAIPARLFYLIGRIKQLGHSPTEVDSSFEDTAINARTFGRFGLVQFSGIMAQTPQEVNRVPPYIPGHAKSL